MTYIVPQEHRFQLLSRVNEAILGTGHERDMVFRAARERMVEQFAGYITEKCIRSTDRYMGFAGSTLHLDVYVLASEDLHAMLDAAYAAGLRSKDRFAAYYPPHMEIK